ncbi:MAG: DNA primase [Sphingobacteriaceae bacterium]
MITQPTIDKIMEATDIAEVVGEFVQLKKRGANLVGLSPFSNERTPSFTVSPGKGIFKDFSSGIGGTAVTFLMEHEKFTYPEALKWLAKKYGVEVEETETTPENKEEENRRESLFIATGFAAKFFQETLWNSEEGQQIALSYFRERGFKEDVIRKFELGFSPDAWEAFTTQALKSGYQEEFLVESGLSVKRDNGSLYDRYRGRVMFPIHSFTGRVIGFGGRTLKNDKSVPKYVNSPESEIYHKSNVLYGLYFAKKAIRDEDNCYLVEGYADVLSVHQAGIENVVASSGTSLTVEQIRLIGRSTKNITILYDGDAAGVKASLRGLDMILEEGLNVKVVPFPNGQDPDSYVRQLGTNAFKTYIEQNKKDFILYKTHILLKEAGNDPIRRADIIREIVESIAKIPDAIKASVFIRECSNILQIEERSLIAELNKMRLSRQRKENQQQQNSTPAADKTEIVIAPERVATGSDESQEKEIVRLLLTYGNRMIDWDGIANTYIGPFMVAELSDVEIMHPASKAFITVYQGELDKGLLPDEQFFTHSKDKQIADMSVSLLSFRYTLSDNWYEKHKIYVPDEQVNMKATILGAIFHLKKRKVDKILEGIRKELQSTKGEADEEILLNQYMHMKKIEKYISDFLGSVILK